ncbi:hypothetical protein [Moraxella cuniculi]|uniref:Uncharacterized protein n=1 Tax=Moraxella cuniculi TaxID=34061 RepID=A0A448GWX0_9GAMM|nr:hypothetical protein [Moraxella cuniculi]VEG13221.1 Uncharacterised protein [Moraxella cuniculi]
MKKLSILALSATFAITPAFAEMTTHYNTVSPQTDLSFAFDDSQNLQATAMTEQEMAETEGAWFPVAIALNVGGRFVANQLVKHYIGNASLAYGTYSWGKNQGKK